MKLVDTAPGSAGRGSSFPFSLDKGQAWEAPAVCGWGEDTGKLRAEGWSWELRPDLPLSRATRPVHTLNFSASCWVTIRLALFFQEILPDPTAARPCPGAASNVREVGGGGGGGILNTLFLAQHPRLGAFGHC